MSSYLDDPRYQEAWAAYAAEDYETEPEVLYVRRIEAATRMRDIEREYATDGQPHPACQTCTCEPRTSPPLRLPPMTASTYVCAQGRPHLIGKVCDCKPR